MSSKKDAKTILLKTNNYSNKRTGGYSGGLAIVAANNAEEAHKVYCFSDPNTDYFDKDGNYCNPLNSVTFSNYDYKPDGWKEVPCLTADVTEPTFIAEDGHTE